MSPHSDLMNRVTLIEIRPGETLARSPISAVRLGPKLFPFRPRSLESGRTFFVCQEVATIRDSPDPLLAALRALGLDLAWRDSFGDLADFLASEVLPWESKAQQLRDLIRLWENLERSKHQALTLWGPEGVAALIELGEKFENDLRERQP